MTATDARPAFIPSQPAQAGPWDDDYPLTARNVKVAAFASEETLCFEASIYWRGKRVGVSSNDGRGGPNLDEWDSAAWAEVVEYARTHWIPESYPNEVPEYATPESEIEDRVGMVVQYVHELRALKRKKDRFWFAFDDDLGGIREVKCPPGDNAEAFAAWVKKQHPGRPLTVISAEDLARRVATGTV